MNAPTIRMFEYPIDVFIRQRFSSGDGKKGNVVFGHLIYDMDLFFQSEFVGITPGPGVLIAVPAAEIAEIRNVPYDKQRCAIALRLNEPEFPNTACGKRESFYSRRMVKELELHMLFVEPGPFQPVINKAGVQAPLPFL